MSYSFKKLSEVALETEVQEANAIVEVDGEIKRMPMSASTGGGNSSGGMLEINAITNYDGSGSAGTYLLDKTYEEIKNAIPNAFIKYAWSDDSYDMYNFSRIDGRDGITFQKITAGNGGVHCFEMHVFSYGVYLDESHVYEPN